LFDIASDTDSFEAFRREVEAFFDNAGETPLREWNEAVEDVRAGRLDADWLVRRPADSRLGRSSRAAIATAPVSAGLDADSG
jgi:hypothetical protein